MTTEIKDAMTDQPTSGDIPTPETDAAYVYEMLGVAEPLVRISLAEDLERRLATATAERDEARKRAEVAESKLSKVCRMMEIADKANDEKSEMELACSATFEEAISHDAREMAEAERDSLRAEVDRLRKEREWQPIETAPKDGTRVLLWWVPETGDPCVVLTHWACRTHSFLSSWHNCPNEEDCKMQWGCYGGAMTHWMPLPDAPKQQEG